MKDYQIFYADSDGLQMLRNRIVIRVEEHTENQSTAGLMELRQSCKAFAPVGSEQAQIADGNGYPLTPWMSLS